MPSKPSETPKSISEKSCPSVCGHSHRTATRCQRQQHSPLKGASTLIPVETACLCWDNELRTERLQPLTQDSHMPPSTTPSTHIYSSLTVVQSLERAFNLDTKNVFPRKDVELRTECTKMQFLTVHCDALEPTYQRDV